MRYDSIVWDFDGVLVDSQAEVWRAASEILALLGIDIEIRSQLTFRRYFTQSEVLSESDKTTLRLMHGMIMRSRTHLLATFPCLTLVHRLNVPSEIVTSGSVTVAQMVLGETAKLFVNIRGREDGTKDVLFHTVSPSALCITDTIVDVERCHKHSLAVIAVGWGYDSIASLKNSRPTFFVESFEKLESLLEKLGLL